MSLTEDLISFKQCLLELALKHFRQAVVKAKTAKEALSGTEAFEEANPSYNKKTEFNKNNILVRENLGENPTLQDDFARMRRFAISNRRIYKFSKYEQENNTTLVPEVPLENAFYSSLKVQCRRCQDVGHMERECPSLLKFLMS